jgi:uncharacterized protein
VAVSGEAQQSRGRLPAANGAKRGTRRERTRIGSPPRSMRLALIGTLAGLFAGLFGVGGGIVIVPLLVFWLGYGERQAAATSLAAIVFIATFGAALEAGYGDVNLRDALLIGGPALAGVVVGTKLQQRLPARAIALLFAVVLVAAAVQLVAR